MEATHMTPFFHPIFLLYYFKINPPFSAVLSFLKIISTLKPGLTIVNKHTVDYHPSPSQLISRIRTLIFLWTPKGFISPESFLNIFLNLHIPPWLQKSFNLVFRLLQTDLCVKKLSLFMFTHAPKQNSTAGFYHYPPGRRDLPIPPEQCFLKIFFPEKKGGRGIWS